MPRTWTRNWPIVASLFVATSCGDPSGPDPVATRLEFSAQVGNAIAGAPLSPQVRVLDASGNAFTGAISVTLTLTASNGATLSGTTSASASNGVVTFSNVRIEKAGTGYVLNASAGGLAAATSNSFDIGHAAAAKLRFLDQPLDPTAGQPISPAVRVEITDQYDNQATDATHAVTMSRSGTGPGPAVLGATTVAAVAGVATFNSITISQPGGVALLASATGLSSVTSATFNVHLTTAARVCEAEAAAGGSFATLADAIISTHPNGTVRLCDGVHEVNNTFIVRPLTIVAEHKGLATIRNTTGSHALTIAGISEGTVRIADLVFEVSGTAGVATLGHYDHVVVEGSTFRAVGGARNAVWVNANGGPASAPLVIVRGNTATGFQNTFVAEGKAMMKVVDNVIESSSNSAIHFGDGAAGLIQRNRITNCGDYACIAALSRGPGRVEIFDNEMRNAIVRQTSVGMALSGRVDARRNRIVGVGGSELQDPVGAASFAIETGIIVAGDAEAQAVVEGNDVTSAFYGIYAVSSPAGSRVRDNRITRVVWAFVGSFSGPNDVFERNDIVEYKASVQGASTAQASFRCNWWGRGIGPIDAVLPGSYMQGHVPSRSQWQPFSSVPIAGRAAVTCDPQAPPAPTRFCPPEFASGNGWDDLRSAIAVTAHGGTVLVCDGTHGVDFAPIDRPLTIAAEHPHQATLTSSSGPLSGTIFVLMSGTAGTNTFRDLNLLVQDGSALVLGTGSTSPPAGRYDQVVFENNRVTITRPNGHGVRITPSDIATAKVVVRGNTFIGGRRGVHAESAGAVDVLGNTFENQVPSFANFNASIDFTSGGPYVARNNVVKGCATACIQANRTTAAEITDNTLETPVAGDTRVGISLIAATANASRNTIRGIGAVADRSDGNSYAFKWAGSLIQLPGSSVTFNQNSITNARTGIWSNNAPAEGRDNTITLVKYGIEASGVGPTIQRSDITDYVDALVVSGPAPPGFLACNWWGFVNGPQTSLGASPVYYTPFSKEPIARKPEVVCE